MESFENLTNVLFKFDKPKYNYTKKNLGGFI